MNRLPSILLTALAVLLLTASHAHAYLDPGTGSAIVQGVLAAFAALAVTAKLYWHRLLRLLGIGGKTEYRSVRKSDDGRSRQSETGADGSEEPESPSRSE
ncbi:MAG: hypothetical protein WEB57_12955 [Pseudohongiellaceae bacterium]